MEAFAGCINLTGINIPDGIKVINAGTFMGTKALKNVKIPGSVEYMYSYAFKDSGAIENDEGIYYVDKWAVDSDNDIERADIRMGTVGTIEGLFVSKNKLKVITVPESVIHLGKYLSFGLNMPVELVEFSCPAIPSGCLGNVGIREVWINDPNCKIEDDIMTLPSYWKEPKSAPVKQEDNEDNDYTIKHVLVSSANSSAGSVYSSYTGCSSTGSTYSSYTGCSGTVSSTGSIYSSYAGCSGILSSTASATGSTYSSYTGCSSTGSVYSSYTGCSSTGSTYSS